MKKSAIAILILGVLVNTLSLAQNGVHLTGIEHIYVEATPVKASIATASASLADDAVCYRIFVDMTPNSSFVYFAGFGETHVIGGTHPYPLEISTTTEFFNTPLFGSTQGELIPTEFIDLDSSLIYDSFVSLGGITNTRIGVPKYLNANGFVNKTPVECTLTPGFDLSMFGSNNSSIDLYTIDDVLASLVVLKGPIETDSTIVMIGQFTTNGIFKFSLNTALKVNDRAGSNKTTGSFATGLWNKKWTSESAGNTLAIQFSPLTNVYGPGIVHPIVTIPFGADGDTVVKKDIPVILKANAFDPNGTIDSVEFRINDEVIGIDYVAPYEMEYLTRAPSYIFNAVAIDNQRAVTLSKPVTVFVSDINLAPSTNIISPAASALIASDSILTVKIESNDPDGYVDSVVFFVNNNRISRTDTVINNETTFSWSPGANGNFTLKAKSYDNSGSYSQDTVWLRAGALPKVSILSPLNNSSHTVADNISIEASASDADGTISYVVFMVNNIVMDTVQTAPYKYTWTPQLAGSSYQIKAIACDNDGLKTTSSVISVTVGTSAITNTSYEKLTFAIYPNPADDELTLMSKNPAGNSPLEISIFSQLGLEIKSEILPAYANDQYFKCNVSELNPGFYFIQIKVEGKVYNQTFIKK